MSHIDDVQISDLETPYSSFPNHHHSSLNSFPTSLPFPPFRVLTTNLERISACTYAHQPRIPRPSSGAYCAL